MCNHVIHIILALHLFVVRRDLGFSAYMHLPRPNVTEVEGGFTCAVMNRVKSGAVKFGPGIENTTM